MADKRLRHRVLGTSYSSAKEDRAEAASVDVEAVTEALSGAYVETSDVPVVRFVETYRTPAGTDDAAIAAAIAALPSDGGIVEFDERSVYVPTVEWDISTKAHVTFRGLAGYFGALDADSSAIHCGAMTVPLVSVAEGDATRSVGFERLNFDGTDGDADLGTESTTWPGLLASTKTSIPITVFTDHVVVKGSQLEGAIGLDLRNCMVVDLNHTRVSNFTRGRAKEMGATGTISTTITARKCYFNYNRECYKIGSNVTDVHYDDCVFESSVIIGTSLATKPHFTDCYFENIGYNSAGGPFTAGLPLKNAGISFGAGTLDTAVDAAFSDLYSSYTFDSCRFAYLFTGAHPLVAWFHGAGQGSGIGANGACRVRGSALGTTTFPFFKEEARGSYTYEIDDGGVHNPLGKPVCVNTAEARRLTRGFVSLPFTGGGTSRVVEVEKGLLRLGFDPTAYTGAPAESPSTGGYAVGDRVLIHGAAVGGHAEYICTVAGSPGTWQPVGHILNGANTFGIRQSISPAAPTTPDNFLTFNQPRETLSDEWGIRWQSSSVIRAYIRAINKNTGNSRSALTFMVGDGSAVVERIRVDDNGIGFLAATPVGKRTLGAAATDAATTQTLANNLRQALIDLGLGQT